MLRHGSEACVLILADADHDMASVTHEKIHFWWPLLHTGSTSVIYPRCQQHSLPLALVIWSLTHGIFLLSSSSLMPHGQGYISKSLQRFESHTSTEAIPNTHRQVLLKPSNVLATLTYD